MDFRVIVGPKLIAIFVAPLEWKKNMLLRAWVRLFYHPAAHQSRLQVGAAAPTLRKIQGTETMYEWLVEDPDCSGVPLTEVRLCW
jgi:hypothetical protein